MRQGPAKALNGRHGVRTQPPAAYAPEPAGMRDDQVGLIFRNMRLAMRVPRETIARRLATTSATIDNFEAGAIAALPHWKETSRIVCGYCELLRMDPEPILWRMRRRRVRRLFVLSAPVAAAAGLAMLVQVAPGPAYQAVGLLPGAVAWPVRAGLDYAVMAAAPRRDGLKWIEVGDPRLRKADKLQTSSR
jgi:hypothetical protein